MKTICFKKISFILILSTCLAAGHKLMAMETEEDFFKALEMIGTKADKEFCQELARLQARDANSKVKATGEKGGTISQERWTKILERTEKPKNKEVKEITVIGSVGKKTSTLLVRRSTASTNSQEGSPPDTRLKLGRSSNEGQKQDN